MKIESIRRRPAGTKVTIGTETYHFQPETANGPHVAEVTVKPHIERLLGITEGYRRATTSDNTTAPLGVAKTPPASVITPATQPAKTGDDGNQVNDGTKEPKTKEPQTKDSDNAGSETKDTTTSELSGLTDEELRDLFQKELGRKPSKKAGRDTMIAQIETNRQA